MILLLEPIPSLNPTGSNIIRNCTLACWLAMVVAGMGWLSGYANTPDGWGETPRCWPEKTILLRREGQPQLVMFIHPRCPCTQASLTELEQIVGEHRHQISLVATVPADTDVSLANDWIDSYGQRWARDHDVKFVFDIDGHDAERFGAQVSGFCVVYDTAGKLRFRGGITSARGHAGWNAGTQAIAQLLKHESSGVSEHSVFGCCLVKRPTDNGY